jgi:hypothetical protein
MDEKDKAQDKILRDAAKAAAEIGAKTALETYNKEKQKEKRRRADRRLRDTKRLMNNYREIKIHAGDAITALSEVENEDFEFFHGMLSERVEVESIIRSKAKSAIMLTHIDAMLKAYKIICNGSNRAEDHRRYRILTAMSIEDPKPSVADIADMENIDVRTVYRDYDIACEKMSALLFGIEWIER